MIPLAVIERLRQNGIPLDAIQRLEHDLEDYAQHLAQNKIWNLYGPEGAGS